MPVVLVGASITVGCGVLRRPVNKIMFYLPWTTERLLPIMHVSSARFRGCLEWQHLRDLEDKHDTEQPGIRDGLCNMPYKISPWWDPQRLARYRDPGAARCRRCRTAFKPNRAAVLPTRPPAYRSQLQCPSAQRAVCILKIPFTPTLSSSRVVPLCKYHPHPYNHVGIPHPRIGRRRPRPRRVQRHQGRDGVPLPSLPRRRPRQKLTEEEPRVQREGWSHSPRPRQPPPLGVRRHAAAARRGRRQGRLGRRERRHAPFAPA
ncbi:hypothetical protein C8Q77DRAFT_192686 [Trametes polyzona]|nr:hypothetical protein C8Q77DRAFT_192686 [Trametes polyzona]